MSNKKKKNRFRKLLQILIRNLIVVLILSSKFVFTILPTGISLKIGSLLGSLGYLFLRRDRKLALEHLEMAFGDQYSPADRRQITRKMFRHLSKCIVEFLSLPKFNRNILDNKVTDKSYDSFTKGFAAGKGIILLSAHFGNWEIMNAYFNKVRGFPVRVVARSLYDDRLDEVLNDIRRGVGRDVLMRGNATRSILKALRGNEVVGMLADQDTRSGDGIFVDFFGRPAYTQPGPAVLAIRTGAAILPVAIVRQADDTHVIEVGDFLEPDPALSKDEAIHDIMQRYTHFVEKIIRDNPEQWVWMHKRWRTQPDNV
jgi:Kdo2-lipid IVA lauroyltransferase/acyltransferase